MMILNNIYKSYKLKKESLKKYGFIEKKNYFELKKDINDSLYILFEINDKEFIYNVYEKSDDSLYLPFTVVDNYGTYVSEVRSIVDNYINDIKNNCFSENNIINKIWELVDKKYQIRPEYLWENDKVTCVLRNERKKWFLIYMEIRMNKLGIKSDEMIGIINVKMDSNKIREYIDNKNYFLAYHMNKKNWITIMLDNNIKMDDIMKLIENSYDLVLK